ncbi:hypothetical protein ABPG75_006785 [Micractinium tetrahymenae]
MSIGRSGEQGVGQLLTRLAEEGEPVAQGLGEPGAAPMQVDGGGKPRSGEKRRPPAGKGGAAAAASGGSPAPKRNRGEGAQVPEQEQAELAASMAEGAVTGLLPPEEVGTGLEGDAGEAGGGPSAVQGAKKIAEGAAEVATAAGQATADAARAAAATTGAAQLLGCFQPCRAGRPVRRKQCMPCGSLSVAAFPCSVRPCCAS